MADFGNEVVAVDTDAEKIDLLLAGKTPMYEPGLQELISHNVERKRLRFSHDVARGIRDSDVIFVAVGTPSLPSGDVDLTYVMDVARIIGENLNGYKVVANKSTVPVGTARKVAAAIAETGRTGHRVDVVSNPEFLREGSAVSDFLRPDRVVIGMDGEKARPILEEIYRPLYLLETPIIFTDLETAELVKYASNAFLAVKISFINEIANLCEKTGSDVHTVAKTMGLDGRISPKFLHPGPGFGGSCFPKDTKALARFAKAAGVSAEIVEAAIRVNERQKSHVVPKLRELLPNLKGATVGLLGLSFKPNTDDIREAPSQVAIADLLAAEARVLAYDPAAMDAMERLFPHVTYCAVSYDVARGADAVVLLTEWNEFREIDLDRLRDLMRQPNILDCRNVYDPRLLKEKGFQYLGVGRGYHRAATKEASLAAETA